jgi:hypothetical protein
MPQLTEGKCKLSGAPLGNTQPWLALASDGWTVKRAMGIEPTRAARSEHENIRFGAAADAKCD